MESNFRSSIDYLILKDTLELIRLYNTNPGFKRILDRVLPVSEKVTYKGRLLRAYLWTIQKMTPVSPSFRRYRMEVKSLTDNNRKAEVIGALFKTYYQEKDGYYLLSEKARQAVQDKDFSLFDDQKDRAEVERIYRLEEPQKRQVENKLFERLENQGTGYSLPADKAGGQVRGDAETVFQPAPRFTARSFTARSFTAPSFVKDLASNGQIFIRRLITRFPLAAATVFSSAVGALAGAGAMESSQGAVLGGVAGGVLPAALKAGLPGLFRNFGGAANLGRGIGLAGGGAAGARLAAGLAGGPVGVALTAASFLADEKAKKLIKWVVIGIGVTLFVVLVMIPMGLLKTTSLFGPGGVGTPSGPSAPSGGASMQISKTGVTEVQKGGDVLYKIQVTYKGEGSANIKVTDNIPSGYPDSSVKAVFNSFSSDTIGSISCNSDTTGTYLDSGRLAVWDLTNVAKDTTKTLCLKVNVPDADTYLSNSATAEIVSVNRNSTGSVNGVRLALSGPNQVPDIDTAITYTIEASYLNPGTATIQIYNKLPANLTFQSTDSTGGCSTNLSGQYDSSTDTITWSQIDLKQNDKAIACLTVKPTTEADKTTIENAVKAKIVKIDSPVIAGGDEAANDNTCSDVYSRAPYPISINPLHKNFGDPSCTLSQLADRDNLYTLLRQQDPTEAAFWFWMAECEASYIPNAYTGDSPANGAWGLYQMGASVNGPGNPGSGKDGLVYDRGDVSWPRQVSNAVNHKNLRESQGKRFHSSQSYWQCAYPNYCSGANPPAACNSSNRPR